LFTINKSTMAVNVPTNVEHHGYDPPPSGMMPSLDLRALRRRCRRSVYQRGIA
jgi:hypothetical protein